MRLRMSELLRGKKKIFFFLELEAQKTASDSLSLLRGAKLKTQMQTHTSPRPGPHENWRPRPVTSPFREPVPSDVNGSPPSVEPVWP